MRVLISGGGTGGHLIPGIALYREMKKRGHECLYVLRDTDLRYDTVNIIDEKDRLLVHITGISRKLSLKTPLYLLKLIGVFFKIFRRIRRFKPDMVLTTGGYVSNPVAFASKILKNSLYIAEQNSVAGITNRFYSKYARAIFTSIPNTEKLRNKRLILTGNPILFTEPLKREEALKIFTLKNAGKIIGISGGSQGAGIINDTVFKLLNYFKDRGISLIWSLGAVEYSRFEKNGNLEKINKNYPNIRAYRFIENMGAFYSSIDAIISRAGATSIAEYIAWSIPALLIPIYKSPDDHQLKNADYLRKNGCALITEEPELNSEVLSRQTEKLLDNIEGFKEAYKSIKSANSAKKIADFLESEVKTGT